MHNPIEDEDFELPTRICENCLHPFFIDAIVEFEEYVFCSKDCFEEFKASND
jgi:hypothetical protein